MTPPKSAQERYLLGRKYFFEEPRNPAAAVREFERAISLDPVAYQEAYGWLAMALKETGQINFAIAMLREAMRGAPEDPRLPILLGGMLMERKDFRKAARMLRHGSALKTQRGETDGHLTRLVALLGEGKNEDACAEWSRILAQEPMYPGYEAAPEETKALLAQDEGTGSANAFPTHN